MDNKKVAQELVRLAKVLTSKNWKAKIDLKRAWKEFSQKIDDDEVTSADFKKFQHELKTKLLASNVIKIVSDDSARRWKNTIDMLMTNMDDESFNVDDFDHYWKDIYDLAGSYDIWIEI